MTDVLPVSAEISSVSISEPSEAAEKRAVFDGRPEFGANPDDLKAWRTLLRTHLPSSCLPKASAPCTVEAMTKWLQWLDLTPTKYRKLTATALEEFIELNLQWRLRAWLGTVLELLDGEDHTRG
jgi:hypothetical protein